MINKKTILILCLLLISVSVYSQEFTIQIIDSDVDGDESHLVDLDGDSDLDIVVASTNTNEVLWYENQGELNFQRHLIDNTTPVRPQSLDVGDFNNDGYKDIIAIANDGFVYVYFNNNNNQFDKLIFAGGGLISNEDVLFQPTRVKAKDLNNDGKIDIVVSNTEGFPSTGQLFIYLSDNNDTYILHKLNESALSSYNHICELKDINDDNSLDIISTDASGLNDSVNAYINDGSGNFSLLFSKESNYLLGDARVLDVNQNGQLDVFASTVQSGLEVYTNNGDNTFTLSQTLPESEPPNAQFAFSRAIKIVDWNNDNLPDVLVSFGSYGDDSDENIQIFINQGDGSFSKETSIFFGSLSEINVFDVSDIDNDGDIDIVALARTKSEFGLINGLTGLFVIINNEILDVDEYNSSQNQFKVFPNPADSVLTIKGKLFEGKVIIYNMLGQLIFSRKININLIENSIDIYNLQSGFYVIKNGNNNSRFVKN